MSERPLKYASYSVAVRVEDGKPLCWDCGQPMVEMRPDQWCCPMWAPIWQTLLEDMR